MGVLNKLCPLLMAAVLTGCYEDFVPGIDSKPVICLNSLITAGEPITVDVSHTWLYDDEQGAENHRVADATVSVYIDDVKVSCAAVPEEKGVFVTDYAAQEGDRIRIVAESPRYGRAEAEVEVPVATPISDVAWEAVLTDRWDWEHVAYSIHDYYLNLRTKIKLDDPADTENYYHFAYAEFPEKDPDEEDKPLFTSIVKFYSGTFYYEAEPIFGEHIGVLDSMIGSDAFGFTFFTDRQFSGSSYTLNIQFRDMKVSIYEDNPDFDPNAPYDPGYYPGYSPSRSEVIPADIDEYLNCGITLTLSTVSQSYYNWSCYDWNISDGTIGDLSEIGMGEPIWGYSNVSTGAGVVAAQSRSTYTINLHDFLLSLLN